MDRKKSESHRKAKKSLSKLLAATAGTLVVASAAAPKVEASVAPVPEASLQQKVEDLRANLGAPAAATKADQAPIQLAWWGNWHNGGWHPYWHNWPNWRNWHNWHNW